MDQPSIDGFNTYAVSRAAHEAGLKVVLSGLGGDELFGSYPSFKDVPKMMETARRAAWIPGLAAALAAGWRGPSSRTVPSSRGCCATAGRSREPTSCGGVCTCRRSYPALMGRDAAEEALQRYDPVAGKNGHAGDAWTAVHELETSRYMRNQLLRDSDWASMASSVELRVPLVDAWLRERLAANGFEPARSQGKAALVRQVAPELPAALWTRPKSGFFIPVLEWLEPGGGAASLGGQSRRLAGRVLAEGWGVERPPGCTRG